MAGDWIKVEHATIYKPEVLRIAEILKISRRECVGVLIDFWVWLDANTCLDSVPNVSRSCLDSVLHCPGLSSAMESVGWVAWDDELSVLRIVHFENHNGQTAKTRATSQKNKAKQRENKAKQQENADHTLSRPVPIVSLSCPDCVPIVSRSNRDKNETREEKRREEEDKDPLLVPQGTSPNSEFPNSQIPNLDPPIRKRKSAATPPKVGGRYQYPPEFNAIVAAYVPVGSPVGDLLDAWRAWSAIPDAERADLATAVANYCRSCARSQTYTKHLATFLRDRWRGWIELSEAQQASHDPEEAARLAKRREFNRQLEETRTNRLAKEQARQGPQLPPVRIKTV